MTLMIRFPCVIDLSTSTEYSTQVSSVTSISIEIPSKTAFTSTFTTAVEDTTMDTLIQGTYYI